jgi:hypothetical protein
MANPPGFEAEAWVLTTDAGRLLLAEVSAARSPGPAEMNAWRKLATAEQVSAALRLDKGRQRGRAKFSRADQMWFDPIGLEQATAEAVARHKARRFAESLVVDLCSGIGGDAIAIASTARVLAVDLNPGMCRRTLWNASIYDVADRVAPIRARAESFPLPSNALLHIDPDRRGRTEKRAKNVANYRPGLEFLVSLPKRVRGGAIKLGPASDFAGHFASPTFEVELVSLGGECKEATVWFGTLASCRRRATRLPEGVTWTDREETTDAVADVGDVGGWIFDPDPTLGRSGLLDAFASSHSLRRCAHGIDFLTGDTLVVSPFLSAFEVDEVLPFDIKKVRQAVTARDLGTLEIKTRGVDVRPETLRAQLRLEGTGSGTLLLVGGSGRARAVLAHRRPGNGGAPTHSHSTSKP